MFQDGIWSTCFNVVVCARIQKRKKKNSKTKIEKYRKEEKKFSSNFEKCNVRKEYCFEEEDLKKIMLNGNSKKS